MTVDPNSIDLTQLASEHLERADLLRDLLRMTRSVHSFLAVDDQSLMGTRVEARDSRRVSAEYEQVYYAALTVEEQPA